MDPSSNGHQDDDLPPLPARGRGVMLLVSVSGLIALNLILGSMIGAILGAAFGLEGRAQQNVFMGMAGAGAILGVWFGVRMGERFGGTSGLASRKRLFAFGLSGLAIGLALAAAVASPFVPLTAIMLPGVAAVLGDALATRKLHAAYAARAQQAEVTDQSAQPTEATEQDG